MALSFMPEPEVGWISAAHPPLTEPQIEERSKRLTRGDCSIPRPGMNDTVAKREVRLVPPFLKGGLGGIWVRCAQEKSPPTPLFQRGEIVLQQDHECPGYITAPAKAGCGIARELLGRDRSSRSLRKTPTSKEGNTAMNFHLTEEQETLRDTCRQLAADFAARTAQHDREASAPSENYEALKHAGLFGLTVPKELGGLGAGFLTWAIAAEELAQGCPSTALTFNMHVAGIESLMDGPDTPESIKRRVADLAVREQKLFSYSVTEPGGSSIALGPSYAFQVEARRVPGGYALSGRKSFVSMVESSNYVILVAHVEDDEPLAGTLFLVPYPTSGQRIEAVWDTLGMRATRSNTLVLEDCFVPEENLCFRIPDFATWFTTTPMWGIGFSYTPVYLGVGVAAYHAAREAVRSRTPKGFAQPLSYHPDIRRRIGEMDADLEAARLLMYQAAWMFDTVGMSPKTMVALMRAKYVVGEAVAKITRSALTACGAHGLFKQSPLERLFRDGASAPIMPPQSDTCLDVSGMLNLGLDPAQISPTLKVAE